MPDDNIVNSFIDSIESPNINNLREISEEIVLDSILDNELIKEIPVFGLLSKLYNTGLHIREKIFAKKIYNFLYELRNISDEKRKKIYKKIDKNDKYRSRVGDTLIMILDKLNEYEKSSIIGKLFKTYINEEITYSTFIRLTQIVESSFLDDLIDLKKYFKYSNHNKSIYKYFNDIQRNHLNNLGVLNFVVRDSYVPPNKTIVNYKINELGEKLIKYGLDGYW